MTIVHTVTGPIDSSVLGVTLTHEHVMTRSLGVAETWPGTFDRTAVIRQCVEALQRAHDSGVETIIDHTTFDIGRDAELLREVSDASGVNIVAITGVWVDVPRWFDVPTVEEIADLLAADLAAGIAGTGIRAGLVKTCLDDAVPSARTVKVARAAALAARRTGVPLSTHTSVASRSGLVLQQLLAAAGADLESTVIGHSGDTTDMGYLRALLDAGSFVGLDRFGAGDILDDGARIAVLRNLVDEGFIEQLLLSHDASCFSGWRPASGPLPGRELWAPWHLTERLLPGLVAAGVDASLVHTMMVDNPRHLFERAAASARTDHLCDG